MAIGIVLGVFGVGFFCWLLFTLAVYALPFLAGLTAGLAVFHSGAGLIGALVVGFLVGVTILVLGQIVLTTDGVAACGERLGNEQVVVLAAGIP